MLKNNLKLIGKNQEDLEVISAYIQDSIVIVKDIVFLVIKTNDSKNTDCIRVLPK